MISLILILVCFLFQVVVVFMVFWNTMFKVVCVCPYSHACYNYIDCK